MDFDAWLDEATLPEDTVPLCLDGRLVREYEAVKDRIDDRAGKQNTDDVRLGQGAHKDPEKPELDRLTAEIQRKTRVFTLRAMPREAFQTLMAEHPPRKDPATGRIDVRDAAGGGLVNLKTFYPALAKASIVDPDLAEVPGRWSKLLDKLTDRQVEILALAGWALNREDKDLPFSPGGSPSPPSSATA